MIKQKLEKLMKELDTQTLDFIKNVDDLRLQISPGSFSTSTIVDSEKKVSALERILSSAGGFMIGGVGSAAVGAVFGYQEMLRSIIPQVGLAVGAILLGFTNPFLLIPLLMGGGLVQGIWKMQATNDKVKQAVANEYIKQVRNSKDKQSTDIADSVRKELEDFKEQINQGLEKEIQNIRDQVNSILDEKKKGEANVSKKLKELEEIENNMTEIERELNNFISEVTLPYLKLA